jgi:hypothetical protein
MSSRRGIVLLVSAAVAIAVSAVPGGAHSQPVPSASTPTAAPIMSVAPADGAPQCVPGAQSACACGGGFEGFQQCADDGKRLGACNCAGPQRPSLVPMNFLSYRGDDSYTVEAGGQSCATPCTLLLTPGPRALHASGSGDVDAQFVMPHLPAQLRLAHDGSGPYVRAGAVLVPTGIIVAASMWAVGLACPGSSDGCYIANFTIWPVLGVSMMTTGIVLLAISGKHSTPNDSNRPEIIDASLEPRLRMTGLGLAPTTSGAVGALGFSF